MSDQPETRLHERAPLAVAVQYRTKGSFLVSYSVNLSKGGLFLETENLLPVGTVLTVRFDIPGAPEPIETQARVMWVRRATSDEGMPPGLGLQFDQLEERAGRIIDGLVQGFTGVKLMALADEPAALSRLSRYLKSILSCEVIQSSTAEMLPAGLGQRVDLVLLDLDSAGDSGLMVIQVAAEAADHPVPVIVLTSKAVMKALALKEGAAIVLDNPPTYDALRQCVLDVLGKPHRLG